MYFETCFSCGAVAQLGERDVRNVEARGSIPLSSTIHFMRAGWGRDRDASGIRSSPHQGSKKSPA